MDDELIRDLFSAFGPITIKRMFGGKGVYADGLIIAIELSDGGLLMKADTVSAPAFEAAGCRQWVYEGNGRTVGMPYWTIPESAMDDTEEMATWARLGYEAALRAPPKKPSAKKPSKAKPAKAG